jgi:hypothetical protein
MEADPDVQDSVVLYHGTASGRVDAIRLDGLKPPMYLTPDLDAATDYAFMGGEQDLQDREEAYFEEHGEWPRELYDVEEMWQRLYPPGETPVVLEFYVPRPLLAAAVPDSGGPIGTVQLNHELPKTCLVAVHDQQWTDDISAAPAWRA